MASGWCFFNINGQIRSVEVRDESVAILKVAHQKAVTDRQIGSPLQGRLTKIFVNTGDEIEQNQPLFVIEAMKMESTITASEAGKIKAVHLKGGTMVETDDMVLEFE